MVTECSDRFSVVMSILNISFRSSGEVVGDSRAGSIYWSGEDRYMVQMRDLSRYAEVQVGDSVVTTNFSQMFRRIKIGTVQQIEFDPVQASYNLEVDLTVDLSRVKEVLV